MKKSAKAVPAVCLLLLIVGLIWSVVRWERHTSLRPKHVEFSSPGPFASASGVWINSGIGVCGQGGAVWPVRVMVSATSDVTYECDVKDKGKPLSAEKKINLLRWEAHRRNLKWHVWCVNEFEDEPEKFQGTAWHHGTDSVDGTQDRWMQHGSTLADAALALYFSIQGLPTHPAEPPVPTGPPRKRRVCPPELRGE